MNKLFILLSITILMTFFSSDGFAQSSTETDLAQLPSDTYYQENISPSLRAGEPGEPGGPGGPGGGGEGGNEWVGAPVGEGLFGVVLTGAMYGLFVARKRKKKNNN